MIITIMFKNVLRTFEAETLDIAKNVQPQPKLLEVLTKIRGYCNLTAAHEIQLVFGNRPKRKPSKFRKCNPKCSYALSYTQEAYND